MANANRDQAISIIDAAGQAGGIDEVRRIAERGWPEGSLDLRNAVQVRACLVVYGALCESIGTDAVTEEQAILSIGDEFLPPCARAVRAGGEATVAYYEFLTEQTTVAQNEHDAEITAGHEWHEVQS